uniref:Ubiquitin-like domain-containing protein n=1 Tax=Oncorhynchus tshawytscha TaxID=74940 RepID=A0A8C8BRC4_ONCTS
MILTVKPLQGKECNVQVTEDEKVSTVKELVSERLNIPANQQRLLYKGKALADEHRLSDYSIGPEAKLNLVVRPAGERSGVAGMASSSSAVGGVWQTLSTVLVKHFSPADAAKVQEQLVKDYERSLRQLSMDDIERLAGRLLHPDSEAVAITGGGWCVIPLSDLGNHKSLLLIPRNGRKKSFECMFVSVSIKCSIVKVVISLTSKFNQHMATCLRAFRQIVWKA